MRNWREESQSPRKTGGSRFIASVLTRVGTLPSGVPETPRGLEPLDGAVVGRPDGPIGVRRSDFVPDGASHAWEKNRDKAEVQVNWQFTTADAGMKLEKLYSSPEEQWSTAGA
jgi:hypothetical protein